MQNTDNSQQQISYPWQKQDNRHIIHTPQERRVWYKNSESLSVIFLTVTSGDELKVQVMMPDETRYETFVETYEKAGLGQVDDKDKFLKMIVRTVSFFDRQKQLNDFFDLFKTEENIEWVKEDILNQLKIFPREIYQDLVQVYQEAGINEACTACEQALKEGYEDAFFFLAQHCVEIRKYDDACQLLVANAKDQREIINHFRFELAHFLYTPADPISEELHEKILRLFLVANDHPYAAALRVPVLNQLAGLYGTTLALTTVDADAETIINLRNVMKQQSEIIKQQSEEIQALRKALDQSMPKLHKQKKPSFFNAKTDNAADASSSNLEKPSYIV